MLNVNFGGFYYSLHSDLLEDSMRSYFRDDSGEISEEVENKIYDLTGEDITALEEIYCKGYIDFLNEELETDIEFLSISSPRFYNFETDIILAAYSDLDYYKILKYAVKFGFSEDIRSKVTAAATSSSGYIAFYDEEEIYNDKDLFFSIVLDVFMAALEEDFIYYFQDENIGEEISNKTIELVERV